MFYSIKILMFYSLISSHFNGMVDFSWVRSDLDWHSDKNMRAVVQTRKTNRQQPSRPAQTNLYHGVENYRNLIYDLVWICSVHQYYCKVTRDFQTMPWTYCRQIKIFLPMRIKYCLSVYKYTCSFFQHFPTLNPGAEISNASSRETIWAELLMNTKIQHLLFQLLIQAG